MRQHPRHGLDVIVAIERGQLQCDFRNCTILVRFDDGQAQRFSAAEPESNDSTMLFISNASRFLGAMKRSKFVRIQADFFQQSPVVLEFDVRGYDAKYL